MTTVIETKKTKLELIKECFYYISNRTWHYIYIFFFIYLHSLLMTIFPSSTNIVNTTIASLSQFIGACCVLFQINNNLKILQNKDLIKSIKNFIRFFPKKSKTQTTVNLQGAPISLSMNLSGTFESISQPDDLGGRINLLSKRIDELNKKIDKNREDLTNKINRNQIKNNEFKTEIKNELKKINLNIEDTIVGEYKLAVFGVIMIIYGILVPIIGLFT
jgi:hypothetical protein